MTGKNKGRNSAEDKRAVSAYLSEYEHDKLTALADQWDKSLSEAVRTIIREFQIRQCPRCGHDIPNDQYPGMYPGALSRRDDKTEICSACGQAEAFEDMGVQTYNGHVYWDQAAECETTAPSGVPSRHDKSEFE